MAEAWIHSSVEFVGSWDYTKPYLIFPSNWTQKSQTVKMNLQRPQVKSKELNLQSKLGR